MRKQTGAILGRVAAGVAVIAALATAGCSADKNGFAVDQDLSATYWRLRVNEHVVVLALASATNTFTLVLTPQTLSGAAYDVTADPSVVGAPTWASTDSTKVVVSNTGVLTARATGAVLVVGSQQIGNVTRADTTRVLVTATAPTALTSFRLRPAAVSTDSMVRLGLRSNLVFPLTSNVPGIYAYVSAADSLVAAPANALGKWSTGNFTLQGRGRGTTLVTARTWVYGVVMTDTFTLRVGYPLADTLKLNGVTCTPPAVCFPFTLTNDSITVAAGGAVTFINNTGPAAGNTAVHANIVFDDSAAAQATTVGGASGNITDLPASTPRKWTVPGMYWYTVSIVGDTLSRTRRGLVRVVAD